MKTLLNSGKAGQMAHDTEPKITAYITKYALTAGIQEVSARVCVSVGEDMIAYKIGDGYEQHAHGEGKEWHRTLEAAIERAEMMRDAKLQSIEKQAKRLRELTF